MRKRLTFLAVAIPLCLLLAAFVYQLPPVHDRLAWRLEALRAEIRYALNPPEKVVFVPQNAPHLMTSTPQLSTPTPLPSRTPTPVGPS